MKIYYDTIPNHLVSGKEKNNLIKALAEQDIAIVGEIDDCDVYVFKAFYKSWEDVKHIDKPKVMHGYGVNWREGIDVQKENAKLDEAYQNVDGIVYMSDYAKRITEHYYSKEHPQTAVIWNAQPTSVWEIPKLEGMGGVRCATTAVWRDWKRLHETERLVKKWNKHRKKYRIELFVAGKDGESGDANIHYVGFKNDFEHYGNMHFFLYPSLMETFGNTVAEAIGQGLPCLVTNFGAPGELIGDAGVIMCNEPQDLLDFKTRPIAYGSGVPKVDDDMFEISMLHLMDNYEKYRYEAVQQAKKFSYEVVGNQWREFLNQVKLNYYKK
jgi:hypothetical protein